MTEWLKTVVKIETSNEEFYRLFRQALEDMAALRLPIRGTGHTVFLPAAGLPWFVAPAEGCLAWIGKYGDRDGDGFQEYQTRSSGRGRIPAMRSCIPTVR
jgi:hypothetical protein